MASKGKQLSELLDANGDVLQVNLDNIVVNATSVSDTDNTSTGQLTLPSGTTAQRPATSYTGAQRYNTTLSVMEYYDGSAWKKISMEVANLDSVSGTLYAGIAGSGLTLTGSGFLTSNLVVNFTQTDDSINTNVTVTPSSDTAATVAVPSAVYSNVTAGRVVAIKVTNSDLSQSSGVNITAVGLPSGGTITTSGDYKIHSFTSTGTFTNTIASLSVEYLIVGGGGAGAGGYQAGGGGAGGFRTNVSGATSGRGGSAESAMTLSSTGGYTVTVGAGGTKGPALTSSSSSYGSNGGDSTFNGITSLGGGRGASYWNTDTDGADGGCGGGAGNSDGTSDAGGSGTTGQGYDGGGAPGYSTPYCGGGGGGSGSAGSNGGGPAANGGNGTISAPGNAGTDGRGGGGGASGNTGYVGGDGGDGIVIVRYDTTVL